MKKIIIEDRKTEIVDDIICDSCGKSCMVEEFVVDNEIRLDHGTKAKEFEYMELFANWGYWSKNQKDMTRWTAHICEDCVETKLKPLINFKIQEQSFTTCIHTED